MGARHFSVTQEVDGTYVLGGELTIHDLDYLKDFLESSTERASRLTLSLAEVSFIDTASLQFLIAFKRWMGKEKVLTIKAVSPEVEKILTVSGLHGQLL